MAPKLSKSDNKIIVNLFTILLLIPVFCFFLFKWLIQGIIWICKKIAQSKTNQSLIKTPTTIKYIDSMNGYEFEFYVANLLRKNGYKKVEVTKQSGDFGVDIIAYKDNKKWAFQCKNYNSNLGLSPIQEVYSGAAKYNADIAVVITNSFFSEHAKELAKDLKVVLWDRNELVKIIK